VKGRRRAARMEVGWGVARGRVEIERGGSDG
jgi:hypothetical protein